MGKRFAIVIGVAAGGVMALGAQSAVAVPVLASQTVKLDSKVTLDPNISGTSGFGGQVKSSKHACEVQRKVKLFEVRSGPKPNKLSAKDRSNNHGDWKVEVDGKPARYYAKVVRQEEHTAGTNFVCRGDRSATLDNH